MIFKSIYYSSILHELENYVTQSSESNDFCKKLRIYRDFEFGKKTANDCILNFSNNNIIETVLDTNIALEVDDLVSRLRSKSRPNTDEMIYRLDRELYLVSSKISFLSRLQVKTRSIICELNKEEQIRDQAFYRSEKHKRSIVINNLHQCVLEVKHMKYRVLKSIRENN